MKLVSLAGVASAALALAALAPAPVAAADLGGYRGGSVKDGYAPLPVISQGSGGPCYFRGDVGYSMSNDPTITWPVHSQDTVIDNTVTPSTTTTTSTFITDKVTNATIENTWLAEGGIGCGFGGSRGVRLEAMLGFRGNRHITGEPGNYTNTTTTIDPVPQPQPAPAPYGGNADPMHTNLKTYTLMLNAYKDLGNWGGFTPYVGAGVGAAYHQLDDVYFTGNPALTNRIHGNNDLALAWSLMAGVGIQLSDRAVLDVGYRYIDMGSISSQRSDSAGYVNPAVKFDDLTAHEVKVGIRYSFGGGSDCCEVGHQPLK